MKRPRFTGGPCGSMVVERNQDRGILMKLKRRQIQSTSRPRILASLGLEPQHGLLGLDRPSPARNGGKGNRRVAEHVTLQANDVERVVSEVLVAVCFGQLIGRRWSAGAENDFHE